MRQVVVLVLFQLCGQLHTPSKVSSTLTSKSTKSRRRLFRRLFVAIKACPHWQLCCHFRQQIVARNGNFVAENGNDLLPFLATICCRFVAVFRNNLLPFSATICCQCAKRQQFAAVFGNNLLPVWTDLKKSPNLHSLSAPYESGRDAYTIHIKAEQATRVICETMWSLSEVVHFVVNDHDDITSRHHAQSRTRIFFRHDANAVLTHRTYKATKIRVRSTDIHLFNTA